MKETDIKNILNDLYALDPSLRSREGELIKIIRTLSIKPMADYDPAFAADLRRRLLEELSKKPAAHRRGVADIFGVLSTPRYALVAVAAVLVAGVAVFSLNRPSSAPGPVALNSTEVNVTSVGAHAFGTLNDLSAAGANTSPETSASASAPAPASAPADTSAGAPSMTAAPMMSAASGAGVSGSGTTATPSVIARPISPIYYPSVIYKYVGDPIVQDQSQLDVLKKIPTSLSADSATAALLGSGFGPVDLSTFAGAGITNVTLAQNTQYGYEISLDLANGTISISENYTEWPQGGMTPLKASDIPATSTVIGIANAFLKSHNISTAIYGTPAVNAGMNYAVPLETPAASAPNTASPDYIKAGGGPMIPYYSDTEQVIYPLVVNGKEVYGESGAPVGMTVDVNVRYGRVADVYGIATQSYQSSAYDAITDAGEIIKLAENPQTYPIIYNGVDSANGGASSGAITDQTTTYDLGTPALVYEDMYRSDNNGGSSEFLVPAYAFPIIGAKSGGSPSLVMVPLIKDFAAQNTGFIPPRPMPLTTAPAAQ